MTKLGEICILNMGQSPDSASYNETGDGLPFFQGNADFGPLHPTVRIWCNKPTKIAHAGDILISVRAPIGALNVADQECCIGRGLAALTVDENLCSREYIWYAIANKVEELKEKGTGSTFKAISKNILSETEIQLPSLDRQHQISSILDKLTDLISLRKQQLAKLDEAVKARFIEMFGDPETNPNGWGRVTVDDVCSSIVRGPFGSALKKEFFVKPDGTTYKVYEQKHAIQKSATIGTYYVTEEKFNELRRFECHAGDILMSCSGTMGELYQLPPNCERGIINQALCKFTLNERILPVVFLTYMKETIRNLETKGSGIQNIAAVSYVKAMPINLPSMRIQQQFSTFVEQTDKSKLTIQQSLDKLELLKKSLMQQYFG
jgi:Restriction endonuclease S subunits